MTNVITPEIRKQAMLDIYAMPQYRELNEKYKALKANREFMKAALVFQKMKTIEANVFSAIVKKYVNSEKRTMDIIASMSEEDKEVMNITSNALFLMADVLDSFITEANGIMNKYGLGNTCSFDSLNASLKEAKKNVYRFDAILSDEKASILAGDMSDSLHKMIYNKASSFSKKLLKYAERIDKKTA
jgi:hypothetical protein